MSHDEIIRMPTCVALVLLLLLSTAGGAMAQRRPATAATQPTEASAQPQADIRVWLNQLADADEAVREQARVNLMGLSRDQLPQLRAAVEQSLPLVPSQRVALRDIVVHVYLTGETYEAEREQGFLGIRGVNAADTDGSDQGGLLVSETMPGFCAFRMLRSGDVILRVSEYPEIAIREAQQLSQVLQRDAGRSIHLDVLRRGQVLRIAIKVDARPTSMDGEAGVNALLDLRSAKADAYWQETFAPLVQRQDARRQGVSHIRSTDYPLHWTVIANT